MYSLSGRQKKNKELAEGGEQCPQDLLEHPDPAKLNYWLSRFMTEVRKKDNSPNPPRSLHLILATLQRKC